MLVIITKSSTIIQFKRNICSEFEVGIHFIIHHFRCLYLYKVGGEFLFGYGVQRFKPLYVSGTRTLPI